MCEPTHYRTSELCLECDNGGGGGARFAVFLFVVCVLLAALAGATWRATKRHRRYKASPLRGRARAAFMAALITRTLSGRLTAPVETEGDPEDSLRNSRVSKDVSQRGSPNVYELEELNTSEDSEAVQESGDSTQGTGKKAMLLLFVQLAWQSGRIVLSLFQVRAHAVHAPTTTHWHANTITTIPAPAQTKSRGCTRARKHTSTRARIRLVNGTSCRMPGHFAIRRRAS